MKKASVLLIAIFILCTSFNPNATEIKYWKGQTLIDVNSTKTEWVTARIIKALDRKSADLIFRKWIKSQVEFKGGRIIESAYGLSLVTEETILK